MPGARGAGGDEERQAGGPHKAAHQGQSSPMVAQSGFQATRSGFESRRLLSPVIYSFFRE